MGTVPRQESVSNCSMRHRKLLKWHCWFALFSARASGARENKNMIRPLARIFLRGLLVS
jgi:hypothetical protein